MGVRIALSLVALAAGAALVSSSPSAQSASGSTGTGTTSGAATPKEKATAAAEKAVTPTTFAAPVMLKAGDKNLGEGRYYPSPVFHDMNGDGLADIVIGDLVGKITVAHREKGDGPAKFGGESPLMDFEGKELKFKNW